MIQVNSSGVCYGLPAPIPAMLLNGGGATVNTASTLGAVGFATALAYTEAKDGVVGLTQAAALESSALRVRVNAAAPGCVHPP